MNYFLCSHHASLWESHFGWLKLVDPTRKVSGCVSRNVSARAFLMNNDLQNVTRLWSTDDDFKSFNGRRSLHTENELKSLCETLPKAFFDDVNVAFQKHFVQQWISTKLLPLTLASISPVSVAFARWMFNLPIENKTVKCNAHKKETHLLSLASFVTKEASSNDLKSQTFLLSTLRRLGILLVDVIYSIAMIPK